MTWMCVFIGLPSRSLILSLSVFHTHTHFLSLAPLFYSLHPSLSFSRNHLQAYEAHVLWNEGLMIPPGATLADVAVQFRRDVVVSSIYIYIYILCVYVCLCLYICICLHIYIYMCEYVLNNCSLS